MLGIKPLIKVGLQAIIGDVGFRRLLKNTGWLLSANGANTILSFAQVVLVARTLGVELYGVLGVVITFVMVVNRLTSFRMNEFVVKYVTDALAQRQNKVAAATVKAAMLIEGGSSILAFVIVYLLAPLGVRWFIKSPEAILFVQVYALVILGNLVSESSTGLLHAFDQFQRQATLSTVGQAVTLGGVALAVALDGGVLGILFAYLIGQFVRSVGLMIYAISEANRRMTSDWWRAPLSSLVGHRRSMAKFVLNTNVSTTLSLITKDSDLLWLGYFRNTVEVAYYRLAMSLATLVMMPVSPMGQTVYPEIAREVALHRWVYVRRLLQKGTLLAVVWILPASACLIAGGSVLIPLLYGSEFLPALPALAMLLFGVGFAHALFWSRPALLALGLPEYPTKVNVAVAVLKVLFVLMFVPIYGYLGCAAILAALYFFGVGISVRKVSRTLAEREAILTV